jgi:cytochrome c oxidase cbb3-type subunit 1
MHPFYVIRALGGVLFLIGALIMVYNFWRTIRDAEPASLAVPTSRLAAAAE